MWFHSSFTLRPSGAVRVSNSWGLEARPGGCPSTNLPGNLQRAVSPLWVCLPVCTRKVLAQVVAVVPQKGKALWVGTRPRPPHPQPHPPWALQAPGTKTRKKQTSRGNFPLPWKQSWGGLERRVERAKSARWKWAKEASMITSLPCREHLRTPRPDVLILHSLWCDKSPIKSNLSIPSQPGEGWPPACAGLVFCLRSTSPLMEEPQLLLHCQRSAGERAAPAGTLSVWAPAKPLTPSLLPSLLPGLPTLPPQ